MGIPVNSRFTAKVHVACIFGKPPDTRTEHDEDTVGTRRLNDLFLEIGTTVLRLVEEKKRIFPNLELAVIITVQVASVEKPDGVKESIPEVIWQPARESLYYAFMQSRLAERILDILDPR